MGSKKPTNQNRTSRKKVRGNLQLPRNAVFEIGKAIKRAARRCGINRREIRLILELVDSHVQKTDKQIKKTTPETKARTSKEKSVREKKVRKKGQSIIQASTQNSSKVSQTIKTIPETIAKTSGEFLEISKHFDKLNEDKSHYINTNDICTPMECVKEMVDSVPEEFWNRKNLKILDSCCGNGNFHAYIKTKTDLKNLYFNEINQKRISNVIEYFGTEINLTNKDFLNFESKPQFDMVVSNPPYAKFCDGNKRASKNHNLSRPFIEKALEVTKEGGYLLFIVPDNWMSFSDRNVLPRIMSEYQFRHLNIHGAKKWFQKVGSTFTWFLLQKVPNTENFTVENNYKMQSKFKTRLNAGIDFIPLYYNDTVRKLFEKTIYADVPKYQVETTSYLHKTTKKHLIRPNEDKTHKYRLVHTPKQVVWSSKPHKYQNGWKVFMSLTDRYGTTVDNCGMTQSIAFVRCGSRKEAKRVKKELDEPVYRAINNLTRYGNFNNIRILQRLPKLEYVKLNKQEKELVEYFSGVI